MAELLLGISFVLLGLAGLGRLYAAEGRRRREEELRHQQVVALCDLLEGSKDPPRRFQVIEGGKD